MQKKILALAIAAAFSAPAFADNANVTVYGKLDVSVDSVRTGNGTTTAGGTTPVAGTTSTRVESNVSTLGFKGTEDLGEGLSAVWQIESTIMLGDAGAYNGNGTSTTRGYLGTRNTFLGLKNETAGTVLAGRHDTPYKLATRRFDVFGDTIGDNRNLMGSAAVSSFDNRQDQVVAYVSPSWGGVTLAVAHINLTPANSNGSQKSSSANSFAAWYDANGIYGTLAHENHSLDANAPASYVAAGNTHPNENATKVGFGYTKDNVFNVNVAYEKTKDNLGSLVQGFNQDSHNTIYVSGKFYINNSNLIKVAYTKLGNVTNTTATGAKQFAIGFDHNLSKRTTVYVMYTKLRNDTRANYALTGEPTVAGTSTIAGGSATSGYGATPSAIAAGVKFVF